MVERGKEGPGESSMRGFRASNAVRIYFWSSFRKVSVVRCINGKHGLKLNLHVADIERPSCE